MGDKGADMECVIRMLGSGTLEVIAPPVEIAAPPLEPVVPPVELVRKQQMLVGLMQE
jgi:hypothetical protein